MKFHHLFISLFAAHIIASASAQKPADKNESFSFLVLSDIHVFTPLSFDLNEDTTVAFIQSAAQTMKNINETYGGEFIVMPGDSASYGKNSNADIVEKLGGELSPSDAVYQAGTNCYTRTKQFFQAAGYDTILPCVGDHELGGTYLSRNVSLLKLS